MFFFCYCLGASTISFVSVVGVDTDYVVDADTCMAL